MQVGGCNDGRRRVSLRQTCWAALQSNVVSTADFDKELSFEVPPDPQRWQINFPTHAWLIRHINLSLETTAQNVGASEVCKFQCWHGLWRHLSCLLYQGAVSLIPCIHFALTYASGATYEKRCPHAGFSQLFFICLQARLPSLYWAIWRLPRHLPCTTSQRR